MSDELLLGRNIHLLCKQMNLIDRADLATKIGVSQQSVGQLILGQSKGWRPVNLVAAARYIGLPAEILVDVDLSARPDLTDLVAALHRPGIKESTAAYGQASTKLAALLSRISAAFKEGTLDSKGLDFIGQAIDMALTRAPSNRH